MNNETNLQIVVGLKDEASAAFKNVGDNISATSNTMSKRLGFLKTDVTGLSTALLGGAVAAGGLAVAFGASAMKGFAEGQVVIARVDAILKTMGKSAMENRDAILAAAEATVQKGFDDEMAAESITKLYQRTNDMSKAIELNNFAMDLARFKNISLEEASRSVNLALSGNVRVLKELGVVADEGVTPLQAIAEAQKMVAGQSEAYANTWPGMMAVITETWSNFKDTIGQVLVEALMPFALQFKAWITDPETQKQFKAWTAEFKSWAEVIIPVIIETFRMWFDWLQKIFSTLIKIGETINNIIERATRMAQVIGGGVKNVVSNVVTGAKGVGNILGLAEGGIVTRPTLAVVGEGGEPEAVIPLSRLSGIGGGITININGGTYLSEDVAHQIGDMIVQQFTRINKL